MPLTFRKFALPQAEQTLYRRAPIKETHSRFISPVKNVRQADNEAFNFLLSISAFGIDGRGKALPVWQKREMDSLWTLVRGRRLRANNLHRKGVQSNMRHRLLL